MKRIGPPGGRELNISDTRWAEWYRRYPGVDLELEVQKANAWLARNPSRMWKTLAGMEAWLRRASENSPANLSKTVPFKESRLSCGDG